MAVSAAYFSCLRGIRGIGWFLAKRIQKNSLSDFSSMRVSPVGLNEMKMMITGISLAASAGGCREIYPFPMSLDAPQKNIINLTMPLLTSS
jgi:hypothetical protein